MNLKSILWRSIAMIIVLYMVLGNFAIAGLGITEVIADDVIYSPKIAVNTELQKFIQYNMNNYKGAEIQTSIEVTEQTGRERHLPIYKMELNVQVPSIDGIMPERASIMKSNTMLTNGIENYSVNQNYNKDTGLLVISYYNQNNYSEYKENAKDEFEILYTYPESAYSVQNEQRSIVNKVNIDAEYKVNNSSIHSHASKTISETISPENKTDIEAIEYTCKHTTEVYKGYMYSNEKNKTNYVTDYNVASELSVNNIDLTNSLNIELNKSIFGLQNNTELNTNTIEYKSTKISEEDFSKIFGQSGYIDFKIGEEKYATIKFIDENGNKKFTTIYYIQLKENIEAGKVEYPEETLEVKIETSKPIANGKIIFESEKRIIAEKDYETRVSDLKNIIEIRKINNSTIAKKGLIELKEPTTQMSLEFDNYQWSTLAKNSVVATLKINDTNSSCKLFETGEIDILLPQSVTNVVVKDKSVKYGDKEISIQNARFESGKIVLNLTGEQKNYDINNRFGGVNIDLDLEIDIDGATPSHKESIIAKYNGVTISKEVEIVSKSGLLMESIIRNETKNDEVLKLINENKKVKVSINDVEQVENIEINLVNNYENDLTNVQFIGNLAYTDEENKLTFYTSLEERISVSKGKVLYSTDGSSWGETYTKQAKQFKIILDGNILHRGEAVKAILKLKIPENLKYNEESHVRYGLTYLNNGINASLFTKVGFETEKSDTQNVIDETKAPLETTIKMLSGDKEIKQEDSVYEGQTIETIVTLKNNSSNDKTYTINTVLANAVYYEKYVTGQVYNISETPEVRYHEAEIGDVARTVTVKVPAGYAVQHKYEYVVSKGVNDVSNNINVLENNNKVFESNLKNSVKNAKLQLKVEYAYNEEVLVNKTMSVKYNVKNLTADELKNIKIESIISNGLIPTGSECYENVNNMKIEYDTEKPNSVSITINNLKANENIEFVITYNVNISTELTEQKVYVYNTCRYGTETYLSNKLEKIAYQSKTNLRFDITSNINENKVKVGDNLEFRVHITNNGAIDLKSTIIHFNGNEGLKINRAYIIYNDGKKKDINIQNSVDGNSLQNAISINKNDDLTIVYNVSVKNIEENMKVKITAFDDFSNKLEKEMSFKGISSNSNIPSTPENPGTPGTPGTPENPGTPGNTSDPGLNKYSLSGVAWIDANKDGKRDENEILLQGVLVYLVNSETGKIVTDSKGNYLGLVTNKDGEYKFENIENGKYIVVYEFDINKYKTTKYQTTGAESTLNSDASISKIVINGQSKNVGATNVLELNSDLRNIDIGLIENAKFDLSIEKQISKIQTVNPQGTKTVEYENTKFAKVDLVAKYMNDTSVIVTYKFIIRNNGDVTGYVDSLQDNMPKGLSFSSELNKDWYVGSDGNLYTSALSGIAIEPGKQSEIELILTKETTDESTGTFTNNAMLANVSNIEALTESTTENNKSSADLIVSIRTGSPFLYIGITLGSIAVVAVGTYLIKKKFLNEQI